MAVRFGGGGGGKKHTHKKHKLIILIYVRVESLCSAQCNACVSTCHSFDVMVVDLNGGLELAKTGLHFVGQ